MHEIPEQIMELLKKFKWDQDNIVELLEDALKEHGENGIQSCLEVALGY